MVLSPLTKLSSLLTLLSFTTARLVRIGVILPFNADPTDYMKHLLVAQKTLPAVDIAIERINNRTDILHKFQIIKHVRDSQCSQTLGPLAAIDFYVKNLADVFLGPVCEYAVAPIARFSPHWNIPLITPGALVLAFENKDSEYKLLTRISGPFMKSSEFLLKIFTHFNWNTIGLLLHNMDTRKRKKTTCFFIMETLHELMGRRGNFTVADVTRFDPGLFDYAGQPGYEHYLKKAAKTARDLFIMRRSAPAIDMAIERVNSDQTLLKNYELVKMMNDSRCSGKWGPLAAIEMFYHRSVHVYLGPCCDYAVASVARFSPYWNIPVITPAAFVVALGDKDEYKLLTRITGTYMKTAEFLVRIFQRYGFRHVGMMFRNNADKARRGKTTYFFVMEGIYVRLKKERVFTLAWEEFDPNVMSDDKSEYVDILKKLSKKCRVIVLCANANAVREIMLKAADLGFDNGEYVFFNIDLFSDKKASQKPWYRETDTPENNAKAMKAYESLMTVTLRKPDSAEYREFSDQVKQRASDHYNNTNYGEDEVNSFVGAFHDAVILYALALNETLEAGLNITDGKEITNRMWNRTFDGITGTVSIDENGDRNADYSLLDLNPETEQFEVVANYFGNRKEYEVLEGKQIHWAGGRTSPPADTPQCGFDGSGCPSEQPFPSFAVVIIILGSLLVSMVIIAFFVYRHLRLEAELAEMSWRIRWEDIQFQEKRGIKRRNSKVSLNRRGSVESHISETTIGICLSDIGNKQLFTKTGYYKAQLCAIKPLNKERVEITKPLLLEIKRVRDLQNDHIVRFIGACIDVPNLCIVSEYCPKGSLQDVLENEQIKLDWMFRYSLMQDIIRGLAYLHSSEIRSHGNLKSSNCVVDSRFVLKITDFGLRLLRSSDNGCSSEDDYSYFNRQLWTAPELLRMHSRPAEGTPKGDVYSFAVICQEIVYRNGPFYVESMDLSPAEICRKVKNGQKPYFRPTLEDDDCTQDLASLIRRCWAEDPLERPDFFHLRSVIRKFNKDGDSGNILDNLLKRMEQYANNLESLVEERTSDYLEQKKKAEDLLYLMLPKSVASALIHGEAVAAETFAHTTIYFSDICGFTALSAASSPMQVVDLLNDLYTTFDSIIENFDVYKVETIGDAYMVVSGLPEKNGNLHAREIARMSIALLHAVHSFKIRHRPDEQLKLRIGIHTGPCVAGVVGLKMPRYCLFGDTVNTASRMESNGLPLKIHVSPDTVTVLNEFGTFNLVLRGPVEMKGKGTVTTYWLEGEKNVDDPLLYYRNLRQKQLEAEAQKQLELESENPDPEPTNSITDADPKFVKQEKEVLITDDVITDPDDVMFSEHGSQSNLSNHGNHVTNIASNQALLGPDHESIL